MSGSLLIVGNPDPVHVGAHLMAAAGTRGYEAHLVDIRAAYAAPRWKQRADWWLRGRRPSRLRPFSAAVVEAVKRDRPDALLSIGIAPIDAAALQACKALGAQVLNFLTDDPWNKAHRAPWFLEALAHYDVIFTPRRANMPELERLGSPKVVYLPFAYAPELHFPEAPAASDRRFDADVTFAGGADADRVPLVRAMVDAGFDTAVYGGYWTRYAATRQCARGFLDAAGLRHSAAAARVSLCVGRRANRDGHAMRTYELPAMAACMLVEDTPDHRTLFGADGDAVVYFSAADDAPGRVRELLKDDGLRARCRRAVRDLITSGPHTYADRLGTMMAAAGSR